MSESYPKNWAKVTLMVSPTGEMHAVDGDRAEGDPRDDLPYVGLERIKKKSSEQKSMSYPFSFPYYRFWWMNDNHTFVQLPSDDPESTLKKALECFDKDPWGMLCGYYPHGQKHLPDQVHGRGREKRAEFERQAREWIFRWSHHDVFQPEQQTHPDGAPMTDAYLMKNALHLWANWIETRDPMLSANDLREQKKQPRLLDLHAVAMVQRLRSLADSIKE